MLFMEHSLLRKRNSLLSGAFHLEHALSELLQQNPEVLPPADAARLRSVINGLTKLVPSLRQLANSRQAQINLEEMRLVQS